MPAGCPDYDIDNTHVSVNADSWDQTSHPSVDICASSCIDSCVDVPVDTCRSVFCCRDLSDSPSCNDCVADSHEVTAHADVSMPIVLPCEDCPNHVDNIPDCANDSSMFINDIKSVVLYVWAISGLA